MAGRHLCTAVRTSWMDSSAKRCGSFDSALAKTTKPARGRHRGNEGASTESIRSLAIVETVSSDLPHEPRANGILLAGPCRENPGDPAAGRDPKVEMVWLFLASSVTG